MSVALEALASAARRDTCVQVRFLPEYCRPGVGLGLTSWNPDAAQLLRRVLELLGLEAARIRVGYLTVDAYAPGPHELNADEKPIGKRRLTETPWLFGPCSALGGELVPLAEVEQGLSIDQLKTALAEVLRDPPRVAFPHDHLVFATAEDIWRAGQACGRDFSHLVNLNADPKDMA